MNTSGIIFELTILKQTYFSFRNSKSFQPKRSKGFCMRRSPCWCPSSLVPFLVCRNTKYRYMNNNKGDMPPNKVYIL